MLNEDFFDELDMEEIPQKSAARKIVDDDEISAEQIHEYRYILKFFISAIGKDKKQEWYTSKLKAFQQDFFDILQISRVIEDFSSMDIIFYVQWWYCRGFNTNYEKRIETLDGVQIAYPYSQKYCTCALDALQGRSSYNHGRLINDISFDMGFTVDCSNMKKFTKFICDITKAFDIAVRRNFKSGGHASSVNYGGDGKYQMNITPDDVVNIQNFDERIQRKFQTWFRAFNPELMPKEIKQKYEEFKDTKKQELIPADLKRILLLSGLWSNNAKVEVNGKKVDITLPNTFDWFMGSMRWRMPHILTDTYDIHIHGGKEYKFEYTYSYRDWNRNTNDADYEVMMINKVLAKTDRCNNLQIIVDLSIEKIINMDGVTLDFTKMFPGYNIRLRCKKKKGFDNSSHKPIVKRTIYVIDSNGKKVAWDYEIPY